MKGSLLIFFVALLTSSFCFLVKEKAVLLGFTRNNSIQGRAFKGRGIGRKFQTRWSEKHVCDNGGALQEGVVPTQDSSNEVSQGESLHEGPPKEETPLRKRRKFLNAQKEDDYYHLYLHHIYKKVKLIKKQKYLYNPTKYESVRSYIKRELKECLDLNTAAYLFKATEFYAKGVLDVSVYVSEVVNLLSFFTFNDKCNVEGEERGDDKCNVDSDQDADKGDDKGGDVRGDVTDEQVGVDENAEQILKGSAKKGKTKISKLLQKDEKYKSFCLFFTRLVDSVSGLFCCIGKRSKREEIVTYLKRSNLTDKWQNYTSEDLNLDTNFMIYVIRLMKYKDPNYLCSLRRLKEYTVEQVKEIFINCMRDGLLDLDYLTILQSEFLDRESCRGEMATRIFAPSSEGDSAPRGETQIKHEHLRKLEQNYEALLKKYTSKEKEQKRGKISEEQLKNVICEILDRNVFLHKGDSNRQSKKKKKKKNGYLVDENLIRMDLHEVEEERLQEVIKKWCTDGTVNVNNCANVVKRMNKLLDSHDVNVMIRLKQRKDNGLPQGDTKEHCYNGSNTPQETPKMSDTSDNTDDDVIVRDIRSSRDSKGEETEHADKKVDLSDFSLSNLKKYVTYRKALEMKKKTEENVTEEKDGGEKNSETDPDGLSRLDQDVLKYFDVTQKQDSVIFEMNDFIVERENSLSNFPQEGQPVVGAFPGGVGENYDEYEEDVDYDDETGSEEENDEEVEGEVKEEVHPQEESMVGHDGEEGETEEEEDYEESEEEVKEQVYPEEDIEEELDEEESAADEEEDEEAYDEAYDDEEEEQEESEVDVEEESEVDVVEEDVLEGDNFGGDLADEEESPRGKKEKINKDKKSPSEKLRMELRTRGSTKSKHKFENLFPKNFEEKIDLLMVILKEEDRNKKKVIVCEDEEERNMIRMKCTMEGVEYEQIISTVKNIKRYVEKGGNFRSVCFILMNELASTLDLRKLCSGLSERGDKINGERSGNQVGKGDARGGHGSNTDQDSQQSTHCDVTIYHFTENTPKALALKKLFHTIVNGEDNIMLYMRSRKDRGDRTRETTKERQTNQTGKTNHSDVFVPYRKRIRKKKLSKSEEKWLAFRRRTLKKIDEMKQKAHLIKMRKMKKRDQKVKRVITKLKSRSKVKSKSQLKLTKVAAKKK